MQFTKMHGLGNDFIIIDAITQTKIPLLNSEKIKLLSNRHYGIGFDQLLIIYPSNDPITDFHCIIYNADGTKTGQCGNGIRCLAHFIQMKKLTNKNKITISTYTSYITIFLHKKYISINMGKPIFNPKEIPFFASYRQKTYILFLPNETILCGIVSIGNPHCIIPVTSIKKTQISILGSKLEKHHRFPHKVNISFMEIIDAHNIKLKVYERNVGKTQACGSAACAAVAIGITQGLLREKVKVHFIGGTLLITWNGNDHPLYMTGPTSHVYDGNIQI